MALMGFGEIDDMFRRVDHMMNSMMRNMMGGVMNPFDMMTPASALAMTPHQFHQHQHHHHHQLMPSMSQSVSFSTPYSGYSSYSSSVVTMSGDGRGQPRIYEETASSTFAPGGVRETKRTVRDSYTGRQEMSVGHHIQEKAHVVKKSRNAYTGQQEEEEDFVNVEEEEVDNFEREWQQRARGGRSYLSLQNGTSRPSNTVTIEELPDDYHQPPQRLALPAPPESRASSHHQHSQGERRSTSRERKSHKKDRKPYSRRSHHRDSK